MTLSSPEENNETLLAGSAIAPIVAAAWSLFKEVSVGIGFFLGFLATDRGLNIVTLPLLGVSRSLNSGSGACSSKTSGREMSSLESSFVTSGPPF